MERPDVHIVGARPNFMKAAPVVRSLEARGRRPMLVHTGQHYDRAMSEVFFEQLGLPEPDRNLGIGSGTHASQTAATMLALEELFDEVCPRIVVVYGDVNSTLAAALVAAKSLLPLAHVEAGLRSFDRTMPEEVNRVVTDSLSDLLFTTSPEAEQHLLAEGVVGDRIRFVGNPMIDTLLAMRDRFDGTGARALIGITRPYAVVTVHRPSNVDDPASARRLVSALAAVSEMVPIVLPLHPRGRAVLAGVGLLDIPAITVVDPLDYLTFMALIADAALVLTDSGGIQEETTVLRVPCLTLRENTERPVTITMGTNRLVGTDPATIVAAAERALANPVSGEIPPLWDGRAGDRIADDLMTFNLASE